MAASSLALSAGCTYSRSDGRTPLVISEDHISGTKESFGTVSGEGWTDSSEKIAVPSVSGADSGSGAAVTSPSETPDSSPTPTPSSDPLPGTAPPVTVDTTPPAVVSVTSHAFHDAHGRASVYFEIVFSEPVNFYGLIVNHSVVVWNAAYESHDPDNIYVPGTLAKYTDGPGATTVYFYPTDPLKVLRRRIDGAVMPYNLTVFGDSGDSWAAQDMAGNLMVGESITSFACGADEGQIACADDAP